jgi:uncharacterized RDD family membrane protein YckC
MTWQQPGDEQSGEQRPDRENPDPYAAPPPPPGYGEPPAAPPSYGQPEQPPQPYGQPPAPPPGYGQPQYGQPPYGQPPYGQPPYGQPQYGYGQQPPQYGQGYGLGAASRLPAGSEYASWGARVGASLLDALIGLVVTIPAIVIFVIAAATGGTDPVTGNDKLNGPLAALAGLLLLLSIGFGIWNTWRGGARGQTLGKQYVGIHFVKEDSLRPPGGWLGIAKALIRGAIGSLCGLYYFITVLWPLWDERRQTLEDKILKTLEVRFPGNRLP